MKLLFTSLICLLTYIVFAQKTTGQYIKDHNSGCRVWDYNNLLKDSVTWKGSCIDNYAEGYGTVIWYIKGEEVGKYVGYLKKGKSDGQGKYLLPNNYFLQGVFNNGMLQGMGTINDDGDVMEGSFVDNVLQGKGKI